MAPRNVPKDVQIIAIAPQTIGSVMSIIDPSVQIAVVTACSGLFGAIIGIAGTLINTWITKQSDERKHLQEQIIHTSIEYWYKHHELEKLASGGIKRILPLDTYLIHVAGLLPELINKELTVENVKAICKKLKPVTETATASAMGEGKLSK